MLTFPFVAAKLVLDRVTPLDQEARTTVPLAMAGAAAWQTGASFTTAGDTRAYVTGYGLLVRDVAYTYDGSIEFRIMVGGSVVPDLDGFAQQRGTIQVPRQTLILVPPGTLVRFQMRRAVAALAAQDVDTALVGYYWPAVRSNI